jgi:hypothetical protein
MPSHPGTLPFGIAEMASRISFKVRSLVNSWFDSIETRVGVLAQHSSRASEVAGTLASEVPGTLASEVPGTLASEVPGTLASEVPGTLASKV